MSVDLSIVRTPLIVFAVSLLFCFGAIEGGVLFVDAQEKMLRQETQRLRQMERKHGTAAEDVKQVHVNYPRFQEMARQGIIGGEDRIAWVEDLTTQGQRMNLTTLTYAIAPPRAMEPTFQRLTGDVGLFASDVTLQTRLLHEVDLLTLLSRLERDGTGLLTVGDCLLTRLHDRINSTVADPNIEAKCTLMWLNVRSRSGKWGVEGERGDAG